MNFEILTEEVHSIAIASGESTGQITFTPQPGEIKGVVLHTIGGANTGLVRCALKEVGNMNLVRPQSIKQLRARDVAYNDDGKPIRSSGGKLMTFEVFAMAADGSAVNFTTDFLGELVLIYKDSEYC